MTTRLLSDSLAVLSNHDSCDTRTVTQALMAVFNDIYAHPVSVKCYCKEGLLDTLVAILRRCSDALVGALTISIIYAVCNHSSAFVERFIKLNGVVHLLAMVSHRTNKDEEMMQQTLMLHEEATMLLSLIASCNAKSQDELLRLGALEKIISLCSVYQSNSAHKQCCFNKLRFTEDDVMLMKQLIDGRRLIGKIDTELSVQEGELNILTIDLYDTTTTEDIHINKELVKFGVAWPQTLTDIKETKDAEVEKQWTDFLITKVVDVHCFWAYTDKHAPEKVNKISKMLEDYVYTTDICLVADLNRGDHVCVSVPLPNSTNGIWARGCVIEENTEGWKILLVDYGYIVNINEALFPTPLCIKEIPFQANLCTLKDIQPAPKRKKVLYHALDTLCHLSATGHQTRMEVHRSGATDVLLKLTQLPDATIVSKCCSILCNLSLNFNIRAQISIIGGTAHILKMIEEHSNNEKLLESYLGVLLNLVVECVQNRKLIAQMDGLLLFMKIYRKPTTSVKIKCLLLKILKNLIGDGWRLIDPVNIPDVRGIIEEQIDAYKGSFNLPNLCGDEILEEVKRRRRRKVLRNGEARPDPTYASISVEDLMRKLKVDDVSGSGTETKSEGYKTEETDGEGLIRSSRSLIYHHEPTPTKNLQPNEALVTQERAPVKVPVTPASYIKNGNAIKDSDSGKKGYLFRTNINRVQDKHNAFMNARDIRDVKAADIGNSICAFLNSNIEGCVYVGVDEQGVAMGVNIARKDRDNLRLGMDDLCHRFHPSLTHNRYEIKFVPVLKGNSLVSLTQLEERFIVEVHVALNQDQTLFQTPSKRMYFRNGAKNEEYSVQEIRQRTVEEQENKYKTEIQSLLSRIREIRSKAVG